MRKERSKAKLYDYPLSGNCHKIRLFLSLLDITYERVRVDISRGEERQATFLDLNPRGQVPVYVEGDRVIWDSMAILAYLARRYGNAHWLPVEPVPLARVMQWLAVSENEILYGLARARAVLLMHRDYDLEAAQAMGVEALKLLERRLDDALWLAGGTLPSIADIACFPYVALAPQGEVSVEPFANVRAWIARIQELPGYVGMPGIETHLSG